MEIFHSAPPYCLQKPFITNSIISEGYTANDWIAHYEKVMAGIIIKPILKDGKLSFSNQVVYF